MRLKQHITNEQLTELARLQRKHYKERIALEKQLEKEVVKITKYLQLSLKNHDKNFELEVTKSI